MGYSVKDFRISIPESLIAQYPTTKRQDSRLLLLDIRRGDIQDDYFFNLVRYVTPGDCIIYNDAKVINARLFGIKPDSGAKVEVLLTRRIGNTEWRCLVRPARRIKKGTSIVIQKGCTLLITQEHGEGSYTARFSRIIDYADLQRIGEIPLPKYIKRNTQPELDELRYQTVYSTKYGAVAAPTAGLHFTHEIIKNLEQIGIVFVPITLYIDWATFKPIRENDFRDHVIHTEKFEISDTSAALINRSMGEGRRIVCVGTTSVRAVETAVQQDGLIKAGQGETTLYIYPGYNFKVSHAMITNFHMPDSTLILLVAAFAGKENIEKAYKHAVSHKYRFFSYGDAMFLYNR
jgi:S-adenosylmethionine:tRNA ribosyltransferase-isomerase